MPDLNLDKQLSAYWRCRVPPSERLPECEKATQVADCAKPCGRIGSAALQDRNPMGGHALTPGLTRRHKADFGDMDVLLADEALSEDWVDRWSKLAWYRR